MTKSVKQKVEHKDKLGRTLEVGSKVAVARKGSLRLCSVIKIHSKKLTVKPVNDDTYYGKEFLSYGVDSILVEGPDVLAFVLKGQRG